MRQGGKKDLKCWLYVILDCLNFMPPAYNSKERGKQGGKKAGKEERQAKSFVQELKNLVESMNN